MKRRSFLKGTLATGVAAVAVKAGLLIPSTVLAEWNSAAFSSKDLDGALTAMYGSADASASDDVKLKAPAIAENGAVTPVTVDATGLSDVESISIIATKNPMPLVCEYSFTAGGLGYVSTRIKMGESQIVMGIVKAGGKLLKAEQEVKVTIGGCGG